MTSILGMTELVPETDQDQGQRQTILIVQSAAESLLRLINDILDSS